MRIHAAQLLLGLVSFGASAQVAFYGCSCMPEAALAVCEHGVDASAVVQHKVAGVADTAGSMQCLMELQLS